MNLFRSQRYLRPYAQICSHTWYFLCLVFHSARIMLLIMPVLILLDPCTVAYVVICALRFAVFKIYYLQYLPKSQPYHHQFWYMSLRLSSMISLYLVPRIPVCDHRRLFLSGHICTLTEKYMCGGKNWTKAHSWRGLARTERQPWLSRFWDGTMRCDAMRCEDQRGSHPAN